jgi:hypothetical protein
MEPQPAIQGDTGDLVRIEGIRGSNPLSSTEIPDLCSDIK